MQFSLRDGSFQFIPQIAVYVAALIAIYFAGIEGEPIAVVLIIALYLLYDVMFLFREQSFFGRGIQEMLDDLRAACGYMAFYLPIAVALLAFSNLTEMQAILSQDRNIFLYVTISLIAASVSTLFIPAQYALGKDGETPSSALKLCFMFVLFLQKIAVTTAVCAVVRAGAIVYGMVLAGQSGADGAV